jgi:LPXTG-motif cell wall-anchored protein
VSVLTSEVACDSQLLFSCAPPPGVPAQYPQTTKVTLKPLPTKKLATMPDPCKGVPTNPWCPKTGTAAATTTDHSSQTSGSSLPNTGLAIGLPVAGLVLLGTALVVRRRVS